MRPVVYFLAVFLLLVPKVNLVRFSGLTIGIKPEDFVVLAALLLLAADLATRTRIPCCVARQAAPWLALFGLYAVAIGVPTLVYDASPLFLVRYLMYFSMILFGLRVGSSIHEFSVSLEKLAFRALLVLLVLVLLQKGKVIGGYLTGDYFADVSSRPMATLSNATELGAISVLLLGLVLGAKMTSARKLVALLAMLLMNVLAENRLPVVVGLGLFSLLLLDSTQRFRSWRARVMMTGGTLGVLLAAVLILPPFLSQLPRFETLDPAANFGYLQEIVAEEFSSQETIRLEEKELVDPESAAVDKSLAWRLQRWTYSVSLISSGYLLGVGAGGLGQGIDGFFFRILGESGIPGIILYGIVAILLLRTANTPPGLCGLRYSCIGLGLLAIVLDVLYFSRVGYLFWLVVGIKISIIARSTNSSTAPTSRPTPRPKLSPNAAPL